MLAVGGTKLGALLKGRAEELPQLDPKPQLIFTSPPFGVGEEYQEWLAQTFFGLAGQVPENGSMVVVLGNVWRPPVQSFDSWRALEIVAGSSGLDLCQMLVLAYNRPLLSPSVRQQMKPRIGTDRLADHHAYAVWLGRGEQRVRLQATSVVRVPSLVADRELERRHHSAMPIAAPGFFIRLLTDPGDLVLDPFAGTNATGAAAERLRRRWIAVEPDQRQIEAAERRIVRARG